MRWLWLGAAVLLAAAAASVFYAFQQPGFVAGLVAMATAAAWKAFAPVILKRKSPEEEARWRDEQLTGVKRQKTDGTVKHGNWKGSG